MGSFTVKDSMNVNLMKPCILMGRMQNTHSAHVPRTMWETRNSRIPGGLAVDSLPHPSWTGVQG